MSVMFEAVTHFNYLPEVAAGAGWLLGQTMDLRAQLHVARQRQKVIDLYGEDAPVAPPRRHRLASSAVSSLAMVGTVAGFANGIVWSTHEASTSVDPGLEVVIDRSGDTRFGDPPSMEAISTIVGEIADSSIDAHPLVASLDTVDGSLDMETATESLPIGGAPLSSAVATAIGNAETRNREAGSATNSTGVVVITNGNDIGIPGVVIENATQAGVPISIVNVEKSVEEQGVSEGLQEITEGTKGLYWNIDDVDGSKVAHEVAEDLVAAQGAMEPITENWGRRIIVAAFTVAALWRVRSNRRREPIIGGTATNKGDS